MARRRAPSSNSRATLTPTRRTSVPDDRITSDCKLRTKKTANLIYRVIVQLQSSAWRLATEHLPKGPIERRRQGRVGSAGLPSVGLAAALLALVVSGNAVAQARYDVTTDGDGDFHVEVHLDRPASEFSQRSPHSPERPLSASESVHDIHGVTTDGRTVALAYTDEDGWVTEDGSQVASLKYRIVADHGQVSWEHGREEVAAQFDETYFFVGGVFFLIPSEQAEDPATITFNLPEGWRVTTPWSRDGNGYVVRSQLDIYSNAFALGRDEPRNARAGDVEFTWLMSRDLEPISERVSELMSEVPAAYAEFFGGSSIKQYTLFVFSDERTDGGAFRDSLAVRVAQPSGGMERIVLQQLVSHEIMHLWLGANGIHGEDPNELAWFTEGFTDYITVRLMHEQGLISDDLRDQRLANFVRRALIGRQRSPDISLAAAGARKGQNFAWVYGGGALVAMLLDLEMSRENPDAFRDMMRDLYRDSDQPYSLDRLVTRMDAASGGRASEIIAFVESDLGIPQVRARLAASGIDMAGFSEDEIYLRTPTPMRVTP